MSFCTCGRRSKPGRRKCSVCDDAGRDRLRARLRRRAYKARLRRQQGVRTMAQVVMDGIHGKALHEDAVRARRAARPWKPWLGLPRLEQWHVRYVCDPGARAQALFRSARSKLRIRGQSDGTCTKEALAALYNGATHCSICGGALGDDRSFDHVMPLSKGGPHSIGNLAIAHLKCNNRKRARVPLGPYAEGPGGGTFQLV